MNHKIFFLFILFIGCKNKSKENDYLSKIKFQVGMNLNQTLDSIEKKPIFIEDCEKLSSHRNRKLHLIFYDNWGSLEMYYDSNLNLSDFYYIYD